MTDTRQTLVGVIGKLKIDADPVATADAILAGLRKHGLGIVDADHVLDDTGDEHLVLLKSMRRRISNAVDSDDTPPRDLASLSRRLQEVSREVTSIEEKLRQEGRGGRTNGSAKAKKPTRQTDATSSTEGAGSFDPAQL